MHVRTHFGQEEDLTKEVVLSTVGEQACCDARPSRIRLTHRKSDCQMLTGESIVVAGANSTAAGSTAKE